MPSVQVNFTDEEWATLNRLCAQAFVDGRAYSKREVLRWLVTTFDGRQSSPNHPVVSSSASGPTGSRSPGTGRRSTPSVPSSEPSATTPGSTSPALKSHDDTIGSSGLPVCRVCKLAKNAARPANCLGAS